MVLPRSGQGALGQKAALIAAIVSILAGDRQTILYVFLTFFIFSAMFQISASIVFTFLFSIIALIFCLFLIPFIVKVYYSQVKCGIVFWIKEGVPIYIFANRKFIVRANMFCREVTLRREARLKALQETWR